MNSRRLGPLTALLLGLLGVACASNTPATGPVPGDGRRVPAGSVAMLPIAPVSGPIRIVIQYPAQDAVIDARDSTFLLGSVGTGDATLSINGRAVKVWPNGAWLAWVPLPPPDSSDLLTPAPAPEILTLRLEARSPRDSATLLLKVRRLSAWRADSAGPYIDLASFVPSGVACCEVKSVDIKAS